MKFVGSTRRPHRRGQAMVEFAIISFVLTAMLAGFLGIIVMGLGSFQNNIAAESTGRLLDQNPNFTKANFVSVFAADSMPSFDGNSDLADLGAKDIYRFLNEYEYDPTNSDRRLYDERHLIISRSDWDNRADLGLSEINESLLGQYIFDRELDAYRFPGAVVTNSRTGNQTVLIPLLPKTDSADDDGSVAPHGIGRSFNVTSDDETEFYPVSNDWVAPVVIGRSPEDDGSQFRVILFHPSQPAAIIQVRRSVDASGRPVPDVDSLHQFPVEADDDAVDDLIGDPPSDYTLTPPAVTQDGAASPYGGEFGLGESYAFLKTVRPYRAVFETSSLVRIGAKPIAVKYEYLEDGNPVPALEDESVVQLTMDTPVAPFVNYEDNGDQSLNFADTTGFYVRQ